MPTVLLHLILHLAPNSTKTFPSNATISAPPTTSSSSELKENGDVKPPAANTCPLVTATGAGSKIVHPPEDVSLEEIRARSSKYRAKPKMDAPTAAPPTPSPAMITQSTSQAEVWMLLGKVLRPVNVCRYSVNILVNWMLLEKIPRAICQLMCTASQVNQAT